jgi:hypothetical protein
MSSVIDCRTAVVPGSVCPWYGKMKQKLYSAADDRRSHAPCIHLEPGSGKFFEQLLKVSSREIYRGTNSVASDRGWTRDSAPLLAISKVTSSIGGNGIGN